MEIVSISTHILLFIAFYAEVYLLLSFLDSRGSTAAEASPAPATLPSVAIIVPCFNEEKTVAGTLNSLLALDYPKDRFSIIAVNDGSTDSTAAVLKQFESDPRVTVITKQNGGKHSAMNLALTKTTAEYIGCLDADSFVDPSALKASIARFMETKAAAVTPAILALAPDCTLRFIQQAEYALSVFMRRALASANAVFITPGPFSLFRRDVVVKLGGWRHAHGTEDMEIALRLQEHGHTIANAPDVRVFTKTPQTIRALYKQRVRWTYGGLMNIWDYRHMMFNSRYGALGMIALPSAVISIGSALYFSVLVTSDAAQSLYHYILRIKILGITLSLPTFDLFYFNSTSVALLAYGLIGLTLTLMLLGRSLSKAPMNPISIPLYMFLYSFLAPWWLLGAVVRAGLRAQAPWR